MQSFLKSNEPSLVRILLWYKQGTTNTVKYKEINLFPNTILHRKDTHGKR